MHVALATNLWVFGPEYSLMASNITLKRIIEDYVGTSYSEQDAHDRPDLFLAGNVLKQHLLIEFKRPAITVGRDAQNQALKYADTLTGKLGTALEILIVGGEVDARMVPAYTSAKITFASYRHVIATARTQLEWLLNELQSASA
jgi:hypothetical protein